MKDQTLGKLIDETSSRDAIHIAIAPVVAFHTLQPGDHIGLHPDGSAGTGVDAIGIVDPFLKDTVRKGERFFLCLYPRSITSLRHEWKHPAFKEEKPAPLSRKAESEEWMTAWAMKHMGDDYYGDGGQVSPQAALVNAIKAGEEKSVFCWESARDYIDSEWWGHWETITGLKGDRKTYFRCAC